MASSVITWNRLAWRCIAVYLRLIGYGSDTIVHNRYNHVRWESRTRAGFAWFPLRVQIGLVFPPIIHTGRSGTLVHPVYGWVWLEPIFTYELAK